MAAPYTRPDSPYYPPPGHEPTEYGTIARPPTIFTDDLRSTIIHNLMDGINAAWNGWEQACRFDDIDKQSYYMKYITELSTLLEKVRQF